MLPICSLENIANDLSENDTNLTENITNGWQMVLGTLIDKYYHYTNFRKKFH